VRLERIAGLTLHIRDADILDGTPVLDLKPYIAYSDAHPAAGTGWLEESASDPVPDYKVAFEAQAAEQALWIESRTGLAIRERIQSTLALGPEPHPYRRIRRLEDGMQLAVKEWRVRFTVTERDVRVMEIFSGFRASQLAAEKADDSSLPAHREFVARWPPRPTSV
jgi:tRNA (adenine37-N6)-methyltransferase